MRKVFIFIIVISIVILPFFVRKVQLGAVIQKNNALEVECIGAYEVYTYPTPNKKLSRKYYDPELTQNISSTSTTEELIAVSPNGLQAKASCIDKDGNQYTLDLTKKEYDSFRKKKEDKFIKSI